MTLIVRHDLKALSVIAKDGTKNGTRNIDIFGCRVNKKHYWCSTNGNVALLLNSAVDLPDNVSISLEYAEKALKLYTKAKEIIDIDIDITGTKAKTEINQGVIIALRSIVNKTSLDYVEEISPADINAPFSPMMLSLVATTFKELSKGVGSYGIQFNPQHHTQARRWQIRRYHEDENKHETTQVGFFIIMPMLFLNERNSNKRPIFKRIED